MKRLEELKVAVKAQRQMDKARRIVSLAFGSRRAVHHYEYLD